MHRMGRQRGGVTRLVHVKGGAAVTRVFITGSSDGLGLMAAKLLIEQGHETEPSDDPVMNTRVTAAPPLT